MKIRHLLLVLALALLSCESADPQGHPFRCDCYGICADGTDQSVHVTHECVMGDVNTDTVPLLEASAMTTCRALPYSCSPYPCTCACVDEGSGC